MQTFDVHASESCADLCCIIAVPMRNFAVPTLVCLCATSQPQIIWQGVPREDKVSTREKRIRHSGQENLVAWVTSNQIASLFTCFVEQRQTDSWLSKKYRLWVWFFNMSLYNCIRINTNEWGCLFHQYHETQCSDDDLEALLLVIFNISSTICNVNCQALSHCELPKSENQGRYLQCMLKLTWCLSHCKRMHCFKVNVMHLRLA